MYHFAVCVISWLLLWCSVEAAFKDFVVGPDTEQEDDNHDLALGPQAEPEQHLISFHDVEQNGIVDTDLLIAALMQHAQRMGLSLEQLAQVHLNEDDESINSEFGCNAAESLSYGEQPSWSDVFFN